MQTTIVQNIACNPKIYDTAISASNKCGQLILDVDENEFTDNIKLYLGGIVFHLYIEDDNEYIEIRDRGYVWNRNSDLSIILLNIPETCYIKAEPMLNKAILDLKDKDGDYLYPDLRELTALPVSLIFDDTNIQNTGGGGGGTQYEDADNKEYPLDNG